MIGGELMFNVREMRAEMARAGFTQKKLAQQIGTTEQTLIRKMKTGRFTTDEVNAIIHTLGIDDPRGIFFADKVAYEVTNSV